MKHILYSLLFILFISPVARAENVWSPWEVLSGDVKGTPAVSSWGSGRLDVFVRSSNDTLWHRWFNGSWSKWESMSLTASESPAVVSWGPGRIDLFAVTDLGHLVHRSFQGSWSAWNRLDQLHWKDATISVTSSGPGSLDIFLRRKGAETVHHRSYAAATGWSKWDEWEAPGIIAGPTAAFYGANKDITLGALFSYPNVTGGIGVGAFQSLTSTGAWNSFNYALRGPPTFFIRGVTTGVLAWAKDYTIKTYDIQSQGWNSLGNRMVYSNPAAVSWGGSRIDIFARANVTGPGLAHIWQYSK